MARKKRSAEGAPLLLTPEFLENSELKRWPDYHFLIGKGDPGARATSVPGASVPGHHIPSPCLVVEPKVRIGRGLIGFLLEILDVLSIDKQQTGLHLKSACNLSRHALATC